MPIIIYKVKVFGEGGPALIINCNRIHTWTGAYDFDNSIMVGGNIKTHYDYACEFNSDIHEIIINDELIGWSLCGDQTCWNWIKWGKYFGIITPVYTELLNDENVSEINDDIAMDFRLIETMQTKMPSGNYKLMMACDFFPKNLYNTSDCQLTYDCHVIEIWELKNDHDHLTIILFKSGEAQQGDAPEPDSCRLCSSTATSRPGDL